MAGYSATDKFLHKFYLDNYSISKATLEMEEILHGTNAKKLEVNQYVFVTGLARSGTTAVMRKIFQTGNYASLQYSNMPFLLSPNLWNKKSKIEAHERAHKDGIIIDGNSPEEFDEYFWKAFLKDAYIQENGLSINVIDNNIQEKYKSYINLICLAKGKTNYVSKNNNNVLRLDTLRKIDNAKIILLFRNPLSHAASLMKLHKSFSKDQEDDSFALDYFNYLGHHEFGLNHKPFLLTKEFETYRNKFDKEDLNYWLAIWLNYYSYLKENHQPNDIFICFEDLISEPDIVFTKLAEKLKIDSLGNNKKHTPSVYPEPLCDKELLEECMNVYNSLKMHTEQ
ncbi:sulfotransferase [Aurantibacter sp.]|uniref:sulfotransferase n=1 Tax=Aurantibacter sp. TaxID=2807103 RepID=UPI0032670231